MLQTREFQKALLPSALCMGSLRMSAETGQSSGFHAEADAIGSIAAKRRGETISMFDNYIVEIDDRAVGVIVRAGRAFSFHAVEAAYAPLEGAAFPDAYAAERAARKLSRKGKPSRSGRSRAEAWRGPGNRQLMAAEPCA